MIPFPLQRGGLGRAGGAPALAIDPAAVSLLLHCDGSNGSTTFTDSSSHGATPSAAGNAQISTAQSKFGGASLALDGTGDWIQVTPASGVPSRFNFGTGDFTIESWVYRSAASTGVIFTTRNDGLGTIGVNLQILSDGTLRIRINSGDGGDSASSAVPTGQWVHIAAARVAGVLKTFVDGVQVYSATVTATADGPSSGYGVRVGASADGGGPFNGYIDELRVLKGVGAYTGGFTPPASPFA